MRLLVFQYSYQSLLFHEIVDKPPSRFLDLLLKSSFVCVSESWDVSCWRCKANSTLCYFCKKAPPDPVSPLWKGRGQCPLSSVPAYVWREIVRNAVRAPLQFLFLFCNVMRCAQVFLNSALKSWFCDHLSPCMRQLKIPKIWRRALIVAITQPEKPQGTIRATVSISAVCPL